MQQFWGQQLERDSPDPYPYFLPSFQTPLPKLENDEQSDYFAPISQRSLEAGTKESSINEKRRLAGQRSREKKKSYLKSLEDEVRRLAEEVQQCESEISECKDQLVEALKKSPSNSNEHSHTFAELERAAFAEDPNLDRVNLLIDLIRNRIGAAGRERQANLSYNFKQIVNSMFPALYRYFLNTAQHSQHFFAPNNTQFAREGTWTAQIVAKMKVEDWQLLSFRKKKEGFCVRRREAVQHTLRLRAAKQEIKRQGQIFQQRMAALREDMTPIQVAIMTLFAEKNKLRREFAFSEELFQTEPRKRVKSE